MFKKNVIATGMLLLAAAVQADAKVAIKPDLVVEKETKVVVDGKTEVKRVPVVDTTPGDVLIYTLHYTNTGDEKATKLVVTDAIPHGTVYVENSVSGANSAIAFSVDGKEFKSADQLMVSKVVAGQSQQVKATASDYAVIQWTIKEIAPGQTADVGFRVIVQ